MYRVPESCNYLLLFILYDIGCFLNCIKYICTGIITLFKICNEENLKQETFQVKLSIERICVLACLINAIMLLCKLRQMCN